MNLFTVAQKSSILKFLMASGAGALLAGTIFVPRLSADPRPAQVSALEILIAGDGTRGVPTQLADTAEQNDDLGGWKP